jgi:hypothetical protein
VRHLVRRVLDVMDLRDVLVALPVVGIIGEHFNQRRRALDDERSMLVERA